MSQFVFGSGSLWGVPLTTVDGAAVATPTPAKFGILQDVTFDMDMPSKELHGTYQFPVAIGRGKGKMSLRAKFAQLNATLLNNVLFGETSQPATGQTTIAEDEAGTIPDTPYTITVDEAATFVQDLGVIGTGGANKGVRYKATTGTPTTGQYVVTTTGADKGKYLFAVADKDATVAISYEYTVAASGFTITMNNQLLGNMPTFRAVMKAQWSGKIIVLDLYKCVSTKFSLGTKLDDFAIPEMDISAFADDGNVLGVVSLVES